MKNSGIEIKDSDIVSIRVLNKSSTDKFLEENNFNETTSWLRPETKLDISAGYLAYIASSKKQNKGVYTGSYFIKKAKNSSDGYLFFTEGSIYDGSSCGRSFSSFTAPASGLSSRLHDLLNKYHGKEQTFTGPYIKDVGEGLEFLDNLLDR